MQVYTAYFYTVVPTAFSLWPSHVAQPNKIIKTLSCFLVCMCEHINRSMSAVCISLRPKGNHELACYTAVAAFTEKESELEKYPMLIRNSHLSNRRIQRKELSAIKRPELESC